MIVSSDTIATKRILLSYFEKSILQKTSGRYNQSLMPATINQNRALDQPNWDTAENYSMILMQAAFYN